MPRTNPTRLPAMLHGADYSYEQWRDRPDVLDADFRLMKEAGINALSVGIFAWSMLEPREGAYEFGWLDDLMDRMQAADIRAILATPSGARPAWLSHAYPEVRQVSEAGVRAPHTGRHNHCRTSPAYRSACRRINTRLAQRYGGHPALSMWHVSNEYGAGRCHCALCYEAFRAWLRARYGTLERLNQAWWTTFWSHRFGAWSEVEPLDPSIHGLTLDWQRFTSDQTIDFFLDEAAPLREITPDVPITTNFMQPDVGLDYWRFARHVDIVSWDSYPRWHSGDDTALAGATAFYHDLHRSYRRQPFMLMESTPSVTNWQGVSRPKRPGMHLLSSLQAVAHGSNTVQYFQWRQGRGGSEKFHGAVMTHLNSAESRVFREVSEVGRVLADLGDLPPTWVEADVAVVYDFENEWALGNAELPQNEAKAYQRTCIRHHGAFWRAGVPVDIVDAEAELDAYRIVVAPMLYMIRPGVAERIEAYVAAGGVFVTTYLAGLVDETDLAFLGGFPEPLARTLGVAVEESDVLHDHQRQTLVPVAGSWLPGDAAFEGRHFADVVTPRTARPLARFGAEFYAGSPAVTVNTHGSGEALYLATDPDDEFLDVFYGALAERHGVRPILTGLPRGVSVQRRVDDHHEFVFLMNFGDGSRRVPGAALSRVADEPADDLLLPPYGVTVLRSARGSASSEAPDRSGSPSVNTC